MASYGTNNDIGMHEAQAIISQKNTEELTKLLSNEDELTKLISNLNEVQQMEVTKESLKDNIRRLALRNLDKEPTLIHERETLEKLHEELNRSRAEYKSVRQQYEEKTGETNPEMIWVLLQSAASELERKTEETADAFFYGEKTEEEVTEFERRFIEERKRAHELKVKADKFQELMYLSQSTAYLNSNSHGHGGFH